jgi:hypothetical protein
MAFYPDPYRLLNRECDPTQSVDHLFETLEVYNDVAVYGHGG